MEIHDVSYIGSYPNVRACPEAFIPEFAFIGRSNVGKSSLINMLTARKDLARVSKTPGKTQTINYFLVDKKWYLVDLPGYGYAKISKTKRRDWENMIEGYLQHRKNLQCAFVLVDANVGPQLIDTEFINWMGKAQIPFVMVYTKTDRLKPNDLNLNIDKIQQNLLAYWNELPQQFVTASTKRIGRDELLGFIEEVNIRFKENS